MNSPVRALRLAFVPALFLCSALVFAQHPAPRIRGPIEATSSVPLAGSLNPRLRTAQDLGPLPPDTLIPGITLVFSRSAAQQADLQQLLAQQTDPSSPLYRHWLTPGSFAARFGIAAPDIAATTAWLQSHGFTIEAATTSNPDRITFSGTAAQIQQAFGAELHRFRWPAGKGQSAELHFAPASELSLPPSLAPVTAALLHLSDFRPKPSVRPRPDYTTASAQAHMLGPSDIATMYDLLPFGTTYNGSGQQIAIVGESYVNTANGSSINTFQQYLSGGSQIALALVPGSGVEAVIPGDEGESQIDLEYSGATAVGSNILFVHTGSNPNYNVFDAVSFAITQDIAPVISISYGLCEALLSASELQQFSALLEQANAQGQTIVAASGDSGATACANYTTQQGVTTTQQQALAVGFPASSPNVTAVGGTQMAAGTFTAGTSSYWSSAGAGDNASSLLSYVPEAAWNEDSTTYGLLASGGGASSFFARPAWQTGVPGIPSGNFRLIPDIALQASVFSPGYIICSNDPYIGGQYSCSNGLKGSNGTYTVSGGTSFGAPIFAGFLAILNQYEHTFGLGNVNPALYALAAQPSVYSSAFHDITSGSTACSAGDGNCGLPGESVYATTAGYDQATGLGSLDFNKLAIAWPTLSPANFTPTSITFDGTPLVTTAGSSITVHLSVNALDSPTVTPPTGNAALALDGVPVSTIPLNQVTSSSNATYSLTIPSTAASGAHILAVTYPGDSTHLPSRATFALQIGTVTATGGFTLSAQNITLASNASGSTQVTITPSAGYNGAPTWSASYSGATAQTLCYLVDPVVVNGPTTTKVYIGLGSACNGPIGSRAPSTVQPNLMKSSDERTSLTHPLNYDGPPFQRVTLSACLAFLIFGLIPRRRRRAVASLLPLALIAILSLSLAGCGGGSGSGGGGGGGGNPQPQVYTVTLQGLDSVNTAITNSTTFTLTVN
jgi:subtilase family serine protease